MDDHLSMRSLDRCSIYFGGSGPVMAAVVPVLSRDLRIVSLLLWNRADLAGFVTGTWHVKRPVGDKIEIILPCTSARPVSEWDIAEESYIPVVGDLAIDVQAPRFPANNGGPAQPMIMSPGPMLESAPGTIEDAMDDPGFVVADVFHDLELTRLDRVAVLERETGQLLHFRWYRLKIMREGVFCLRR